MFYLLIFTLAKSYNFEEDYTDESYNSLEPIESPAKLTFQNGLSLMMVEWPDAILNISIPYSFSESVILTRKSGLSYFTFKDPAIVILTFSSNTSYFVTRSPQVRSMHGAYQHIANSQNHLFNEGSEQKDIYFVFFF